VSEGKMSEVGQRFTKRPIDVWAIQWNGGDYGILNAFCGKNWGRADAVGDEIWPSEIPDAEQVVVFNTKEQC